MKVSRPKNTVIRIAADEYLAVVSNKPPADPNGMHLNGQCMVDNRRLEVQSFQQPLQQLWVAYHEVLHAINEQYHIGLNEAQVDQLAHPLASTLYDNIVWWMEMGLVQHPANVTGT